MMLQTAMELTRLLRSQYWSPAQLQQRQWQLLQALLAHCVCEVPFYRQLYRRAGVDIREIKSLDDLQRLPVVKKPALIAAGQQAIAVSYRNQTLHRVNTGGSTGEMLTIYFSEQQRRRRIANIYRSYLANGYGPQHTIAYFQIYDGRQLPLARLGLFRFITMDFNQPLESQVDRIARARPAVLSGYPSLIEPLGTLLQQRGLQLTPKLIISNSEQLTSNQHRQIQQSFGVAPTNIYDSWEFGTMAWQCPQHQGLHINSDLLWIEVDDDGELLVTDLYNWAMPMIRYAIGDRGQWQQGDCPCGRHLPRLQQLEGKASVAVALSDGRSIEPVMQIRGLLARITDISAYQLVQTQPGRLNIRWRGHSNADTLAPLARHIENLFGLDHVSFQRDGEFIKTATGKQLVFHSQLSRAS